MSDYSRQHDFSTKTGTTIFGSEVDDEFDALVTSNNSKIDESREGAASGVATLDAGALMVGGVSTLPLTGGGQLPEASLTLLGAVELADDTEAIDGTDALRVITPSTLDAVFEQNGGLMADMLDLGDPMQDTLVGWDDTAKQLIHFGFTQGITIDNATTSVWIDDATVSGVGITATLGVFAIDFLGLESLTEPAADADSLVAYDGTADTMVWFTAEDGLAFDNAASSIGLDDVPATTTNAIDILAGSVEVDMTALDTVLGSALSGTDLVLVDDGGVQKAVQVQEMGMRVQLAQTSKTLAATDMNSVMEFNGTATLTLDENVTVPLPIGVPLVIVNDHATQVVTIQADTTVVLNSVYHPGGTANAKDEVLAGGTAILFKTEADEWYLAGDIVS